MRNRASCVKVELPRNNLTKGDHIPHEQKYNTRHEVSSNPNEVRGEIWRRARRPEVQQKPVVHLLLETAPGRKCGVPCLSIKTPAQPSEPAHRGRAEAHQAPPLALSCRISCPICLTNLHRKFEILIIFLIFRSNRDMLYLCYCILRQIAHKEDSKWLLVIRSCGMFLLIGI